MAPLTSTSPAARPIFPSYLLPSIKLPFRRRRQTSGSLVSDVPSLSSSPTSSASSSLTSSPPPSLPTYFDTIASDEHATPPLPLRRSPRRLSRVSPNTLRCSTCSSDVAFSAQIVSKGFTGRYGRAYLVSPPSPSPASSPTADSGASRDLVNIRVGKPENRQLVTGWHVVADINCQVCGVKLGWKYVDAREASQKYKVGKFILETERVVGFRSWEDVDVDVAIGDDVSGEDGLAAAVEDEAHGRKNKTDNDDGDDSGGEIVFDSEDEDECEDIFAGTWDPVVVAKRRSRRKTPKQRAAA